MTINSITNKINAIFIDLYKSIKKLNLITKLFLIFLILLFTHIIFNKTTKENLDNNTDNVKYIKKIYNDIYDDYFTKKYDVLFLNNERNEFEVNNIKKVAKNKNNKILDVGCGTGLNVRLLNDMSYNIIGLDQSESMVNNAKKNNIKCKFINGNILNNNLFDFNSFNIITCLGKTIYEIKNKDKFFENCYSLLEDNGLLIVNLVDRDKFKPYVQSKSSNILFNPEEYKKKIENLIVKFKDNLEFNSKYNLLTNKDDKDDIDNKDNKDNKDKFNLTNDNVLPYSQYYDEFIDDNNNKKVYELNLYMPEKQIIRKTAESHGFNFEDSISLNEISHDNEYLYIFKK